MQSKLRTENQENERFIDLVMGKERINRIVATEEEKEKVTD